jgi:hypothetical protein
MPTFAELKVLLRPLLKRRRELKFVRRVLFFAPLSHYVSGVAFGWSSYGWSDVIPFGCPLYTGEFIFDVRAVAYQDAFRIGTDWKDNPERASRELCDRLEHDILPSVQPIVDFESHMRVPKYLPVNDPDRWDSPSMSFWRALAACTVGNYDLAEELLRGSEEACLSVNPGRVVEEFRFGNLFERLRYLLHFLRADRARVLPLLHDWEAYTVQQNKVGKYWKPSPFACEL